MDDIGNSFLLEDGTGNILNEDGIGQLILESGPDYSTGEIKFNNYLFVKVGDGMSTGEKIR